MDCPESENWLQAMHEEMEALNNNDTWDLVDLPVGKNIIKSKWMFKIKLNADGSLERYKCL
jgi:Reverse transcriptase (RNA-dependent DNA polymerase).